MQDNQQPDKAVFYRPKTVTSLPSRNDSTIVTILDHEEDETVF